MAEPTSQRDEKLDYDTSSSDADHSAPEVFERPTGLKGLYYNPHTQLVMLGFVCFMFVSKKKQT
jgi:hypothetical protein